MQEITRRDSGITHRPEQLDPMTVAQVFRASGMFPDIQSEAQAATKIIIGRGLGLTDFDAMSGLHIIKGKAVLAANLMAAAIKRAGKYDYRAMVTDDEARVEFRQRKADGGWETIGITSFTMEDAKRAGLGGDNWRRYPRAMLFARCISSGYKAHCPDALGAAPVYVEAHGESEIPDEPPATARPVAALPPAQPQQPADEPPAPAAPAKRRSKAAADAEALMDPTPVAARGAAPAAPAAAPAAPAEPSPDSGWGQSGSAPRATLKRIKTHPLGRALLVEIDGLKPLWVQCAAAAVEGVREGSAASISYAWDAAGYYRATAIGPAEQLTVDEQADLMF